jgi:ribonuclease T1
MFRPRLLTALLTALWLALLMAGLALPAEARERAAAQAPVMAEVLLEELPVQAHRTLVLIRQGGPFPYRKDGSTFANRERLLPLKRRGYYTEYTVPTPSSQDRGARRIVAGGNPASSDELYYTDDHYASFRKIRGPMQ